MNEISTQEMKRLNNFFLIIAFISLLFVLLTIVHLSERREKTNTNTSITDEN